jgi:hypothetical protein
MAALVLGTSATAWPQVKRAESGRLVSQPAPKLQNGDCINMPEINRPRTWNGKRPAGDCVLATGRLSIDQPSTRNLKGTGRVSASATDFDCIRGQDLRRRKQKIAKIDSPRSLPARIIPVLLQPLIMDGRGHLVRFDLSQPFGPARKLAQRDSISARASASGDHIR